MQRSGCETSSGSVFNNSGNVGQLSRRILNKRYFLGFLLSSSFYSVLIVVGRSHTPQSHFTSFHSYLFFLYGDNNRLTLH